MHTGRAELNIGTAGAGGRHAAHVMRDVFVRPRPEVGAAVCGMGNRAHAFGRGAPGSGSGAWDAGALWDLAISARTEISKMRFRDEDCASAAEPVGPALAMSIRHEAPE